VGSTPAIMGNKIKQSYIEGERFFELIIDTGSSSVANGVIRICNGECLRVSCMHNAVDYDLNIVLAPHRLALRVNRVCKNDSCRFGVSV
jgi:hypothetical protein